MRDITGFIELSVLVVQELEASPALLPHGFDTISIVVFKAGFEVRPTVAFGSDGLEVISIVVFKKDGLEDMSTVVFKSEG